MGQSQKKPARASHKPRKGNSDYTYDDLVNTAGFEHMFSFLKTRHPDAPIPVPAPIVGAPDLSAPTNSAPDLNAPTVTAPIHNIEPVVTNAPSISESRRSIGAPVITAPIDSAPTLDAPDVTALAVKASHIDTPKSTGAPFLGAPDIQLPTIEGYDLAAPGIAYDLRRYQPRPTRTAQDGHTIGEQELYEALWNRSKQVGAYARAITIGERTMAREVLQTPRSYSSVQENLRSLAAKLALDILPGRPNGPKTYVIYSHEETLRRRRQAGLTYYRKRASAVELVHVDTTSGAPTLSAPDSRAPI